MIPGLFNIILRAAELAFAAVVAGITGWVLHKSNDYTPGLGRFIYTEVIAALSIITAFIFLIPFSSSFIHYPWDFFLSVCWFVSFGLLVHFIGDSCGYIFNWNNVAPEGDMCGKFKANIAFSFILAICFLVSAFVGIWWNRRRERRAAVAAAPPRRAWYRRHHRV
ncbi:unnamed protein product [Parascedosporium putredinis]|uniref:MARVEL domain-containing protein n=1 Tax=Parascedosporium putredinis TaxID=1442378 RepID=A0A9P1M9Z9_9PEZI|nr:unnamed protein product [Parascedosporium putredinis]CAI7995735.1 unnamed protein product [Parascedosporium putredinis]